MKKRILSILITGVLAAGLLAGCGGNRNTGSNTAVPSEASQAEDSEETHSKDAAEKMTVNVGDQAAFFLVKVAEEKGFFEEEFGRDGITVNSVIYEKMGPAIIEAMAEGDVDLSIVGIFPVVNANNAKQERHYKCSERTQRPKNGMRRWINRRAEL